MLLSDVCNSENKRKIEPLIIVFKMCFVATQGRGNLRRGIAMEYKISPVLLAGYLPIRFTHSA
jgi:hypothetical protein